MHVLGIDAGATKTVCYLADGEGRITAEARGGGADLRADGELAVEKVLHAVMEQAVADRGRPIAAICLGMAGAEREPDACLVRGILHRIGLGAPAVLVSDALVALVAGLGDAPGVVILSGTGSIAYGRNARNETARAGGWGQALGDEGSGYWIGRQALRAVTRAADGRGPATALTPRLLTHFAVAHVSDLIAELHERPVRPHSLARLARVVQQAKDEGDLVATRILEQAGQELLAAGRSVVERLRLQQESFPILLAGGVFAGVPWLADELCRQLPGASPRAQVRRLEAEPALGAVRLALAEARGGARLPVCLP